MSRLSAAQEAETGREPVRCSLQVRRRLSALGLSDWRLSERGLASMRQRRTAVLDWASPESV